MHTLRSELIRIWRPAFCAGIGVMALAAAIVSIFIFTSAEDPTAAPPTSGEGPPAFTVAEIASPGGFLTALSTVSTLAGVMLLVLWAIAAWTQGSFDDDVTLLAVVSRQGTAADHFQSQKIRLPGPT